MNVHVQEPTTKPRPWQSVEYEIFSRMAKVGKTDVQIAGILGRHERDVWKVRRALGCSLVVEKPPVRVVAELKIEAEKPTPEIVRIERLLAAPPVAVNGTWEEKAKASTAFLISMLRAGHKPGQGEYQITSEARFVRPSQLLGA